MAAPPTVAEPAIAPTPPVLSEGGAAPPEGEPEPVPEATPEQVPQIVAEASGSTADGTVEATAEASPDVPAEVQGDVEPETVTAVDSDDGETAAPSEPLPAGEVPPHEHEVPEHEHDLPEHQHDLPQHDHALPEHKHPAEEHEHPLPEHEHPIAEHEHEVVDHEHDLPEHKHEPLEHEHPLPEHQHEVAEHEHELPEHEHETTSHEHDAYRGLFNTQGADIVAIKQIVQGLNQRLLERDQEIARLKKNMDDSEQVREALAREVALVRADREKQAQTMPVVVYDAEEKRVASVNLFASGHGEALEKLVGAMIHSWQNEGKAVDVSGLPPQMSVKVRDDPQGRGFELFASPVLFLRVTSKEREALAELPTVVSHPDRPRAAPPLAPAPPPPPPASPERKERRPGEDRIR